MDEKHWSDRGQNAESFNKSQKAEQAASPDAVQGDEGEEKLALGLDKGPRPPNDLIQAVQKDEDLKKIRERRIAKIEEKAYNKENDNKIENDINDDGID